MKLYGYWRSTAAYRVRVALAVKQLDYQTDSVHLVKQGGEQFGREYSQLNPNQLVPTLRDGDFCINQSLAIMEYLEEVYPGQSLLPSEPKQRALVRALCQDIACDIHPLNNLRVLKYLAGPLAVDEEQKDNWYHHWIVKGFTAIEQKLALTMGRYCFADDLTMADICLVAQVYNARRFKVDLQPFPRIVAIEQACLQLREFQQALPENQPDAS